MSDPEHVYSEQLKETCKLTGAEWAVWLRRTESSWETRASSGLHKPRLEELLALANRSSTAAWLSGALAAGRVRSRSDKTYPDRLGVTRLYAFPNTEQHLVLLVGTAGLERSGETFFRILAMENPTGTTVSDAKLAEQISLQPFIDTETKFDPHRVLEVVLEYLTRQVVCDAAYLAVRSGDIFRIEAVWQSVPDITGREISIREDELLRQVVENRKGQILRHLHAESRLSGKAYIDSLGIECADKKKKFAQAMRVPVSLGKRVIGEVAFLGCRERPFKATELRAAQLSLDRMAHAIENAIVFESVSRYLQQFALLDELATATSAGGSYAGLDMSDVAQNVVHHLQRAFHTSLVGIMLLTPDGLKLREYGRLPGQRKVQDLLVVKSLAGYVVETGRPVRTGNVASAPRYVERNPGVRSALVVPMNYQGSSIGVISLESTQPNTFTSQDERLLVVIGSHLAGLIENVRLHLEAMERARNQELIHGVLGRVVGLTDPIEIAQATASLVAEYFDYEFVAVILGDETGEWLVNEGVGGSMAHRVPRGFRIPADQGIVGTVFRTGKRQRIDDVSKNVDYVSLRGWRAGSEMCVPLRERERVLGIINVESGRKAAFSDNDLMTLESLAGILSSVIMNARRSDELRENLDYLKAAREIGLDITASLDLNTLLASVVHRVREFTRAKGATFGLVNQENKTVKIIYSEFPWPNLVEEVPFGVGLNGKVALTGKSMIINDYMEWEGGILPGETPTPLALACVPLIFQEQVVGTLTISDDQAGRLFSEGEIKILEFLGPQIAVSIRNASLYQELQERIAAQQLAERKLLRSARLAAVGEMAAGVAHELNNPLTTVMGMVEMALEDMPGDSPLRSDMELVQREARRARGVVRRLLDFSRHAEPRSIPTNINTLISEVVTLVQYQLQANGVQLHYDIAPELPQVMTDPDHIKQVLLNLLHNAMQAMLGGGDLRITTGERLNQERRGIFISIADSGEGIPAEHLDRIFEPFFTTRPVGVGTGLGLSVSYGIVTAHQGTIEVESQAGEGSKFTVWLPLETKEKGQDAGESHLIYDGLPADESMYENDSITQSSGLPSVIRDGHG